MSTNDRRRDDDNDVDGVLDQNVGRLLGGAFDPPRISDVGRARIREALVTRASAAPAASRVPRGRRAIVIGAAFAAAAAGVVGVVALRSHGGASSSEHGANRDGKRVALADGSTAILDDGASLDVLGARRVRVTGRALVDVVPGKGTFTVETENGTIQVLGTRFVVDATAAQTDAAVIRGSVKLATDGGETLLHAGEEGTAIRGRAPTRRPAPRLSHLASWAALERRRAEGVTAGPVRNGTLIARTTGVPMHAPWFAPDEYPLPLTSLTVDAVVDNQVARVAIDQTFHNEQPQDLEAVYRFALPADAALSRLAMYVDGKLQESAVVERMQARRVYEDLVYHRVDPALLEWTGAGKVELRVYPVPALQDKRIVLGYTQSLPRLYDDWTLAVPLPTLDTAVDDVRFKVRVKGCARCEIHSPSHAIAVAPDGADAMVTYERRGEKTGDSLVLDVRDPSRAPRVVTKVDGGFQYLMVRAQPALSGGAMPEHRARRWVILDDVSASRGDLERKAQADVVDRLLTELDEDDQVAVMTFDVRVREQGPLTAVRAVDRRKVRAFLDAERGGVGATDMGVAFTRALAVLGAAGGGGDAADTMIVYLGDGENTDGERTLGALRDQLRGKATFVGVGIGDGADLPTLGALADATGGMTYTIDPADDLGWRAFDLVAALYTPRATGLSVTLVDASGATVDDALAYARDGQLGDGEELEVVARVPAGAKIARAEIGGALAGTPWSASIDLATAEHPPGDPGYLPRLWAQRRVARLLLDKFDVDPNATDDAREAHREVLRKEIVALGKQYFLLSRHTSLLVLENDAMYAQYGVPRTRSNEWMPYALPATIPVPPRGVAPAAGAEEAVLVRTPQPIFYQYPYGDVGGGWDRSGLDQGVMLDGRMIYQGPRRADWIVGGRGGGGAPVVSYHRAPGHDSIAPAEAKTGKDEAFWATDKPSDEQATATPVATGAGSATGEKASGDSGAAASQTDVASMPTGATVTTAAAPPASPTATPSVGGNAQPVSGSAPDQSAADPYAAGQYATGDSDNRTVTTAGLLGGDDANGTIDLVPAASTRDLARWNTGTGNGYGLGASGYGEGGFGKSGLHGHLALRPYGYGYSGWSPIAMISPSDPRLDDLTEQVPAFFPGPFDAIAADLHATAPRAKGPTGSIDAAARALLTAARAHVAPGTYQWGDGPAITVDAAGRLGWRTTTDAGLDEWNSYDGQSWRRAYPELGLDVVRAIGDDEPALYGAVLPVLLPAPDHLARWYDVRAQGSSIVLTVPGAPTKAAPAMTIDLDRDGRVVAIRAGADAVTITWSGDGPTSAQAGGRSFAVTFQPSLVADASAAGRPDPGAGEFVSVDLPLHTPGTWRHRLAAMTAGSDEWRHAERQLLAAAASLGDTATLWAEYQALRDHGGLAVGDVALASRGLAIATTNDEQRAAFAAAPAGAHALVDYLAASRRYGLSPRAGVFAAHAGGDLVGTLSQYREVLALIASGKLDGAIDALRALGERVPTLRLAATAYLSNNWGYQTDVSRAWEALAVGRFRNVARYEAARARYNRGDYAGAADCFAALFADVDLAAAPFGYDGEPQAAFANSARGMAGWQLAYAAWRSKVLAGGDLDHVVALVAAAQSAQPGDLDRVLARAADLAAGDGDAVAAVATLAMQYNQLDRAAALVDGARKASPSPALDRLASTIAERQGRPADAAELLARALAATADAPRQLSQLRADYTRLLQLDARVASLATSARAGGDRDRAIARLLDDAATWRAIDPDLDAREQQLADALLAAGQDDEATRVLSTLVERHPMEGDGWGAMAATLEQQGRLDAARDAWHQAVVIDQTNPSWRLRDAQVLFALGRDHEALAELDDIVHRRWHERWSMIVEQARELAARTRAAHRP